MDAVTFLRTLRDRGVSIQVQGDRIVCRPGSLVKDLAGAIREHKAAILAELKREGPPYPNPEGRVKCVYCAHLQGPECSVTRQPAVAISLLRECKRFVLNREQWNRDQHMLQAEGARIAEIGAVWRVNGMRHYLARLAEGFEADTGLPVHEWCIQAGYLDERGRFTEAGFDFLRQKGLN